MLDKELGHEIPASQMQYNADYKEMDHEDQYFLCLYLRGAVLDNVEKIEYLGKIITNDLKWKHVTNTCICPKANRTLGFLRRNLVACA